MIGASASAGALSRKMQITQRQIKRLEARDRRLAAVHEAGHIVVACKLGISEIGATLTKCADSDPMERTWWSGEHRACLRGVSKQKRTMYAVAGIVAEACWSGVTALDIDWDDPARSAAQSQFLRRPVRLAPQ
jgi:hypothetical protein